jgi:hypothetical protein
MATKPEQDVSFHDSLNDTRKELDEKLNKTRIELDNKIDAKDDKIPAKISTHIFCWVLGIFVVIVLGIFGSIYLKIDSLKDKIGDMQTRISVLETRINPQPNSQPTSSK